MSQEMCTYRIAVYLDEEVVRLYDIRAVSQAAAETAAIDRVMNVLSASVSSSTEDPDDDFDV